MTANIRQERDEASSQHPLAVHVAAAAALAVLTSFAASASYYKLFSHFSYYDDEGYVMLSVSHVLQGHALFAEVFSQYGPSFYLYRWLLHSGLGIPLTHDANRLASIAVLVFCLGCAAAAAYRMTRYWWAAILVVVPIFTIVSEIHSEPGHPQEFITALLLLLFLAASRAGAEQHRLSIFACALILVLTAFTKLNIGLFLAAAVLYAAAARSTSRHWPWCYWPAAAAVMLLPFALTFSYLAVPWVRFLALQSSLSMLPVVLLGASARPEPLSRRGGISLLLGAGLGCSLLFVGISWALGTPPHALLQGMVLQHLGSGSRFSFPLAEATISYLPLAFSLMTFAVYAAARSHRLCFAVLSAVKCVFGTLLLFLLVRADWQNLLLYGLPGVWLILASSSSVDERTSRFPRLCTAGIAGLLVLQCFPVAGSQLPLSLIPLVFVAVLAFGDSARALPARVHLPLAAAVFLLSAVFLFSSYNRLSARYKQTLAPLELPGASRLRLPPQDAAMLRQTVHYLESLDGTFFTYPGMGSFYFWSGKPAPTARFATAWMVLLDQTRQQELIAELEARDDLHTVLRNFPNISFWNGFSGLSEPDELQGWISEHFRMHQAFGPYEFLKKNTESPPALDESGR